MKHSVIFLSSRSFPFIWFLVVFPTVSKLVPWTYQNKHPIIHSILTLKKMHRFWLQYEHLVGKIWWSKQQNHSYMRWFKLNISNLSNTHLNIKWWSLHSWYVSMLCRVSIFNFYIHKQRVNNLRTAYTISKPLFYFSYVCWVVSAPRGLYKLQLFTVTCLS